MFLDLERKKDFYIGLLFLFMRLTIISRHRQRMRREIEQPLREKKEKLAEIFEQVIEPRIEEVQKLVDGSNSFVINRLEMNKRKEFLAEMLDEIQQIRRDINWH